MSRDMHRQQPILLWCTYRATCCSTTKRAIRARRWRRTCSWWWERTAGTAPATGCGRSRRVRTSCWRSRRAGRTGRIRVRKREYWQYDPISDYLQPALQGLMLDAGEYRRLPGTELADGTLALASEVLGLELRLTERGLRLHDPETRRDGSCRTLPKRTLPLRHLRAAAPEPYHGRPPPDAGAGSRGQPHRGASRRYSGRLKPTGSSRVVAERSAQWRPALKNGRAPPTKQ